MLQDVRELVGKFRRMLGGYSRQAIVRGRYSESDGTMGDEREVFEVGRDSKVVSSVLDVREQVGQLEMMGKWSKSDEC